MTRAATRRQVRAFYDVLGRLLDTQAFYENAALEVLRVRGGFDTAGAVLEFGCGTGRFAEHLLTRSLPAECRYLGLDISRRMVALATERLAPWTDRAEARVTTGSMRLDAADRSVDRFLATYVLDLLSDRDARELMQEAHRVLMPGGRLCVASLACGTSLFARAVVGVWSIVSTVLPIALGGCRPVRLSTLLTPGAWHVEHHEVVERFGVATDVLVARPAPREPVNKKRP